MSEVSIAACQRCGQQPTISHDDYGWNVFCIEYSGFRGALNCKSKDESVKAWNEMNTPRGDA